MTDLEELIRSADRLCKSLDDCAKNDRAFSDNVCHDLERMSWETMRLTNDLRQIKDYVGGAY